MKPRKTLRHVLFRLEEINEQRHRETVERLAPSIGYACERHGFHPAGPGSAHVEALGSLCPSCASERRERERKAEAPETHTIGLYDGGPVAQKYWQEHRNRREAAGEVLGNSAAEKEIVRALDEARQDALWELRQTPHDRRRTHADYWARKMRVHRQTLPALSREGRAVRVALKKKRYCIAETKDGKQCRGYRLSAEGAEKLLDAGVSLLADATQYCSFHARTPEERYEMQAKGGAHSKKNVVEVVPDKEPMPKEIAATGYLLIRSLIDTKLPGTNESDARKVALGCYLASAMYTPAETATKILWQLLPRDLHQRNDLAVLAETELRDLIDELPNEEQKHVWAMLNAA